ncbi:hypothetical protein CBR_g24121 [Chara braunii]|uniref:CCHC-type domain-containing protein n=1 Tax=Chara braunii TaxID=69332 RepID=A0A388L5U6_CHABU|nr:hypothetical protein CBR_g24121 [Chara braunii]|eukprot:GBG77675.1 hypothetical protein CBR_g24121 [Chara braunii]
MDRGERERERRDGERDRRDREPANEGGERRSYRPPTCFSCQEVGHYANQCPNQGRRYSSARPSSSTDSRHTRSLRRHDSGRWDSAPQRDHSEVRSTIAKLGKRVAVLEEFYVAEREKKEWKLKRKMEKEEARRRAEEEAARAEEERAKAEKKALRRKQKKLAEDTKRAEMQKDLQVQLAIHVGDLEERLVQRLNQVVSVVPPSNQDRGKKKVTYVSDVEEYSSSTGDGSDTSVTQELSALAERLVISEKRKRGPKPVFEESSPPMDQPAKRTPKCGILKPVKITGRRTRSKSKKVGGGLTPTSTKQKVATPLSKRRTPTRKRTWTLTPQSEVTLERLQYRENVLRELKDLESWMLLTCSESVARKTSITTRRSKRSLISLILGRSERFRRMQDVLGIKQRFDGLVLTGVDRNPGETVVMCPLMYYNAMMDTFVLNPGYRIVDCAESVVLREVREDVKRVGLKAFS